MLTTTTTTTLYEDKVCRVYEGENRVIHFTIKGFETYIPSPLLYPGFSVREFDELYRELTSSGIPAGVAARWVYQAKGFGLS